MGNSQSEEMAENFEENVEKKEKEEPLDLSVLPDELIHLIVNQLSYQDLANLEECSQSMKKTLSTGNFALQNYVSFVYVNKRKVIVCPGYWWFDEIFYPRIPWHVATQSPVRLDVINLHFMRRPGSKKIQKIARLFERSKATAMNIVFPERITFDPADLNRLVTAVSAQQIECKQYLPKEFFVENDALNKLTSLTLHTCGCTDDELLKLKVPTITMINDFLTDRGLNRYLKQWKRKERTISYVTIEFGSSFGQRNFNTILEGLDANPIWTPALHEYSVISKLDITEFGPMQTGDPDHFYSICQKDDVSQIIVVVISNGQLMICTPYNESVFLTNYLTEDQYYVAMQRCRYCEIEFCEHRRWLSQQRVKKYFPRLNSAVILGYKIATYIFAVARCSQLVLGAPCFYRRQDEEQMRRLIHERDHGDIFGKAHYFFRVYVSDC